MAAPLRRAAFALALFAVPPAWAQQSPPPQTLRPPAQDRPAAPQSAPVRPPTPPQPAPRTPVQREGASPAARPPAAPQAPRPAPKPDQRPAQKPAQKPPPRPAAPAVAPVPVPVPAKPAELEKPAEPQKGSNTGLPLPRFAALRSDEVNLRSGPGTRYPITWVYKRRDLPVEIEREFEVWRLVRDQENVKGWVHQATLTGRRTLVVTGADRALRREAKDAAPPVAQLKPGVIARLRSCEAGSDWCQVQMQDYRGWMKRSEFWGVYPGEAVQ